MELRSWVISHVLRLEQTSSSLMRAILRMFNENSKSLGNQSSALSFKSKIDLLYDLEEIDKTYYNHLLKLMEIRNQFAHNPNATSFEELDNINPDINKYLEKNIPEEIVTDSDRETKLKAAFSELFKMAAGKLLVLEIEYTRGIEKDILKHINHQIVENIDSIWDNALTRQKEENVSTPIAYMLSGNPNQLEHFYSNFKLSMSEFTVKELEKIGGDNLKHIFKQKETTAETVEKINKKKESEK
ncbi:hypothetical protein [Flavobacterium sp.]|uniref:hypothetical protein n=1 Tax=Flavobacterium sp. TaxID=239 RepID=UPI00260FD93D|nr:hypothetical protein [Flavobacterium sp.]